MLVPLKLMAAKLLVLHTVWLTGVTTVGVAFTVSWKLVVEPLQETNPFV